MSIRGREGASELAYSGVLGATRYEPSFLTGNDGVSRRIDLVRAVNAVTDPALASAAQDGTLHRLDDGSYLAVPYVYHDPSSRRFALVVPVARAHEELRLRAKLLEQLASESTHAIPAYVRSAQVVIGMEGLHRFLAESAPDTLNELAAAAKEERLRERTDELIRRETELQQRIDHLVTRERDLVEGNRELRASVTALETREDLLDTREQALAQHVEELESRVSHVEIDANRSSEIDPLEDEDSDEDSVDDDVAIDASDDLEGDESGADEVTQHGRTDGGSETLEAEEIDHDHEETRPAHGGLPAGWSSRGHGSYAAAVEGEVRVWITGGAAEATRLAYGGSTLLLQVDPDSALPLALLSVVAPDSRDRIARVSLDLTRPDDRAVLEALGRDFRVRLEVVSASGRTLGNYVLADQCEPNAQRALAVLSARGPGVDTARREECERMERDGFAARADDALGIALADEAALATAVATEKALSAFGAFVDATLMDRFILSHGVPPTRLEAFEKRVILAALRCGIALNERWIRRAIETGMAPDERALVTRGLMAYARTCESGVGSIGRTGAEASSAWLPMLQWAERAGAAVPDVARQAIRNLYDPEDAAAEVPPDPRQAPSSEAVTAMADDELGRWIEHAGARDLIAAEMVRRDPTRYTEFLSRALRSMPPASAAELTAQMIRAGDALGDLWVELLASRRQNAALLAAVASGHIHLRRGLNPLIQRTLVKETTEWRVFAWAAGEFGNATVRAVARLEGVDVERLGWILAHAVRCGGGREVEKYRTASNRDLAEAATRAVGRVDEARAYDAALRQGRTSTDGEALASKMLGHVVPIVNAGAKRGAATPEGV